jgi:hypothetical protein
MRRSTVVDGIECAWLPAPGPTGRAVTVWSATDGKNFRSQGAT